MSNKPFWRVKVGTVFQYNGKDYTKTNDKQASQVANHTIIALEQEDMVEQARNYREI